GSGSERERHGSGTGANGSGRQVGGSRDADQVGGRAADRGLTMTTALASFISQLQTDATSWIPLATILFMVAMVALISQTMTLMPKTKPQEIKPASDQAIGWADIAGV